METSIKKCKCGHFSGSHKFKKIETESSWIDQSCGIDTCNCRAFEEEKELSCEELCEEWRELEKKTKLVVQDSKENSGYVQPQSVSFEDFEKVDELREIISENCLENLTTTERFELKEDLDIKN